MKTVLQKDLVEVNHSGSNTSGTSSHFGKISEIAEVTITAPKGLDGREVILSAPNGAGSYISLLLDGTQEISYEVIFNDQILTFASCPSRKGIRISCAEGTALKPAFVEAFLETIYCQVASNAAPKNTQQLRVVAATSKGKKSKPADVRFRLIDAPLTFPRGVEIETKNGSKAINDVQVGDEVLTVDNGWQPVRWVGSRVVDARKDLAPIFIKQGALGNTDHMTLAPDSGIVLRGRDVRNLVGMRINSLPAKDFVNGREVRAVSREKAIYYHFGLDRPQIIYTQGLMVKVAQILQ